MAKIPGKIGFPFVGDESYEFYKDYHTYISRKTQQYGNIFTARFLNQPTVFIGSHRGVHQLLNGKIKNLNRIRLLLSYFILLH